MALVCLAFIDFFDNQHRRATLEYYVPPPASMGAGVDLPTQAHQLSVINSIVGPGNISQAQVIGYGLKIVQEDVTGVATPGDGSIALTDAFKFRNGVGLVGRLDPFGEQEGIELRIPAANQANVVFDPTNRNAISVSTSNIVNIRNALIAIGFQDAGGTVLTGGAVLETGSFFDGKRAPMRPR